VLILFLAIFYILMKFIPLKIPDVILLEPKIYEDARGIFFETYSRRLFMDAGILHSFIQDNQSHSQKNVLRGLHYQIKYPQGKLVRVISGEIFDVAVDLRRNSPTFRQWDASVLSAESKFQLWIPPGFAHGFYVLSATADVVYKTTDIYAPEWERTLIWNDPSVGIQWPNEAQPLLSLKDKNGKTLTEADLFE
jgi:dTDP-4-dehydrorhamnose 3,5-epimerase